MTAEHDDGPPPDAETTRWRKLSARARQFLRGGGGAQRVSSHGVSG
jgi:hypothetical protein